MEAGAQGTGGNLLPAFGGPPSPRRLRNLWQRLLSYQGPSDGTAEGQDPPGGTLEWPKVRLMEGQDRQNDIQNCIRM